MVGNIYSVCAFTLQLKDSLIVCFLLDAVHSICTFLVYKGSFFFGFHLLFYRLYD